MHVLFHGISVIPVLTIERERDAVPLARALFEGGLPVIEITMRTAAAPAAPPMSPPRSTPVRRFWSAPA